ncbi:MAG TPA: GNAT family N-acetyltransferase [Candidatus Limnocylindria bacterium]
MTGDYGSSVERGGQAAIEVARIARPSELSAAEVALWRTIQAAHAELERPFFAPEWFRALDDAGHAVEIAVLAIDGSVCGFFPFHREGRTALPPGGRLCDFQGWIGPADLPIDFPALLEAIGVRAWRFNHLLARQAAAARYASERSGSPLADLSDGFEAFLAEHKARGSGWVSQIPRKARKLGREVGEVRLELRTPDPAVLAALRGWKRAQRERTRTSDPLDEAWAELTVANCLATDSPSFAGVLSALYAGDELVAAHLGLRSRETLHIWFPTYNPAHESYSPGLILMYELFRAAADVGIGRVDFGKGPARYKSSWMTGEETVAEGSVDLHAIGRLVSGASYSSRRWLRRAGIASLVREPRRRVTQGWRRLRGPGRTG